MTIFLLNDEQIGATSWGLSTKHQLCVCVCVFQTLKMIIQIENSPHSPQDLLDEMNYINVLQFCPENQLICPPKALCEDYITLLHVGYVNYLACKYPVFKKSQSTWMMAYVRHWSI